MAALNSGGGASGRPRSDPGSKVVALRPGIDVNPPELPETMPAPQDEAAARLLCGIEQTLEKGFRDLRFTDEIEQRFEQDVAVARNRMLAIKGLIALVLFDLFLVSDFSMVPDLIRQMLLLRLVIVTPLGLLAVWSLGDNPPTRYVETVNSVLCVLTTTALLYAFTRSHSLSSTYYHTGLPLIVIFANIVQRIRFRYAVATSMLIFVLDVVAEQFALPVAPEVTLNNEMVLFSTILFTLIASYNFERDERRNYLLNLRENLRLVGLEDANQQLARLTELDPLTDLANRRSFERHLKQSWIRSLALRQPLSLLMLDVDHFKAYNDRLGHPAGDHCLKQVASAIRKNVRSAAGELAARIGGEEFAVILPGLDEGKATDVAERIRLAVEKLRIPHEAVSDRGIVSVSIGAATVAGSSSGSPQRLVDVADRALYQAKDDGRNRVRNASANIKN